MLRVQSIERLYSAYIAADLDGSARLGAAAAHGGWTVQSLASPDVSLVVEHSGSIARHDNFPDDVLRIAVGDAAGPPTHGDATISGRESEADLIVLFASWLPPGLDQLDRVATTFGREAMTPLVKNLREELRAALTALDGGGLYDAHKLSGLTGTIGFSAASQAWRELDKHGGPPDDARRATRTAIIAINRWLET